MAIAHDSRSDDLRSVRADVPPPLSFVSRPARVAPRDGSEPGQLGVALMVIASVVAVAAVCFLLGYLVGVTFLGS